MGKKLLLQPRARKTASRPKAPARRTPRAPTLAEIERQLDADHAALLRRAEENTRRLTGKDRF
jgi:hypothetical protein